MDTKAWGPKLWFVMFTVAANYPIEIDKTNVSHLCKMRKNRQFFENLQFTLPCKYCRRSYKLFLKQLPIKKFLTGRRELMYWVYLIKDLVNKKLKQPNSPPFESVCKKYEKYRAKCSEKTKTCRKPEIK